MIQQFSFSGVNLDRPHEVIAIIRSGLSGSDVKALSELYKDREWLCQMLGHKGSDYKNLVRRKRLSKQESEKLIALYKVFQDTLNLFEREDHARAWLFSDQIRAFNYIRPCDFMDTFAGIREVHTIIGRIRHGICS